VYLLAQDVPPVTNKEQHDVQRGGHKKKKSDGRFLNITEQLQELETHCY
jgi:hypothetical protein